MAHCRTFLVLSHVCQHKQYDAALILGPRLKVLCFKEPKVWEATRLGMVMGANRVKERSFVKVKAMWLDWCGSRRAHKLQTDLCS